MLSKKFFCSGQACDTGTRAESSKTALPCFSVKSQVCADLGVVMVSVYSVVCISLENVGIVLQLIHRWLFIKAELQAGLVLTR